MDDTVMNADTISKKRKAPAEDEDKQPEPDPLLPELLKILPDQQTAEAVKQQLSDKFTEDQLNAIIADPASLAAYALDEQTKLQRAHITSDLGKAIKQALGKTLLHPSQYPTATGILLRLPDDDIVDIIINEGKLQEKLKELREKHASLFPNVPEQPTQELQSQALVSLTGLLGDARGIAVAALTMLGPEALKDATDQKIDEAFITIVEECASRTKAWRTPTAFTPRTSARFDTVPHPSPPSKEEDMHDLQQSLIDALTHAARPLEELRQLLRSFETLANRVDVPSLSANEALYLKVTKRIVPALDASIKAQVDLANHLAKNFHPETIETISRPVRWASARRHVPPMISEDKLALKKVIENAEAFEELQAAVRTTKTTQNSQPNTLLAHHHNAPPPHVPQVNNQSILRSCTPP